MALTPDDIVNKRFQTTKFREGYDQDEVDDYLDEVVAQFRELLKENSELRVHLGAAQEEVERLRSAAAAAPAAPAQSYDPAAGQMFPPYAAQQPVPPQIPPQIPPQHLQQPSPQTPLPPAPAPVSDEARVSAIIATAQRFQEETVREATKQRDTMLAEARVAADRLREEAEVQSAGRLRALKDECQALERRISELRVFERDYRSKLRSYIEGQLRDLDSQQVS